MTDFTWPNFPITRFQMRIAPMTKAFASPYTNQVQVIDMLSECWMIEMDLAPDVSLAQGLTIEAFFDRLKGATNRIVTYNQRVLANRGTMRGTPTLSVAATQLANLLQVVTTAGATVQPGDMLGCGGQLFRVMAAATADGSGNILIEVAPRVRSATGIAAGSVLTYTKPTAPFRLASANPAVDWHPGEFIAPATVWREDF